MDVLSNQILTNYINYIKSLSSTDKIIFLGTNKPQCDWTISKVLLDYYNTDRPIILTDGELLELIESHRVGDIPRCGIYGEVDVDELHYLMMAWRSKQYHRLMIHLVSRYIKNPPFIAKEDKIGSNKLECGICWRSIHGANSSSNLNDEEFMKDIAYTSNNTRTHLCRNCLYQLFMFSQLMYRLGDEEFNNIK